jgi:hypothetical protein
MRRIALFLAVVSTAFGFATASARAQANRIFVSGQGSDSNPCSLAAPCRSFARAVTQTNAGGEITVLDSAGYGIVTITQSVTITNPGGVEAGITTAAGQTAITINTPVAASVTLRGLTLEGGGVGATGILLNSSLPPNAPGGTLNIIDCVVKDFTGSGIAIEPALAGGGGVPFMNIVIARTFSLNNGANGIALIPNGINLFPTIYQTTVSGNGTGLFIGGDSVTALFADSHADNNSSNGIFAGAGAITMRHSTAIFASHFHAADVSNNAAVSLYDQNTIGTLVNSGIADTDGTNNIGSATGSPLNKTNPQ